MLEKLLQYDAQLFLFLNSLGNEHWDGFWLLITNRFASIPLYLVLLFLIWKHFNWKQTLLILVTVTLMIVATDQLANLFKYLLVQRPRPCRIPSLLEQMRFLADYCGRYGYFSAHAGSSMALAVFVGLLLKKPYKYLPFLLLFWAAIIAYSRIYIGVHYPLDIITGMMVGAVLGWSFFNWWKILKKRFNLS